MAEVEGRVHLSFNPEGIDKLERLIEDLEQLHDLRERVESLEEAVGVLAHRCGIDAAAFLETIKENRRGRRQKNLRASSD